MSDQDSATGNPEKGSWLRSGTEKPVELGPEAQAMKSLGESLGLKGADLVQLIAQGAKRDFDCRIEREQREEAQRLEREREQRREDERQHERRIREEELRQERERWQYIFERDEKRWEAEREEKARERERTKDSSISCFKVKIAPLTDKDDIDLYLRYFERIAATHGWSDHVMALRLLPLLQGVALECVMQLPPEEIKEYKKMRDTLLFRFKRTAEHFRKKFRDTKKESGESFLQCGKRMKSYIERWFELLGKDIGSVYDVFDVFMQEAVFKLLHSEMEVRVREQRPTTYNEILKFADNFAEARSAARPSRSQSKQEGEQERKGSEEEKTTGGFKCYKCHGLNHKQADCPNGKVKVNAVNVRYCEEKKPSTDVGDAKCSQTLGSVECKTEGFCPNMEAVVNGSHVLALRDTGADTILVAAKYVEEKKRTGRTVTVSTIDPEWEREAELAIITIDSPWLQGEVEAVVLEKANQDLIIGNQVTFKDGSKARVPFLPERPRQCKTLSSLDTSSVLAVETRNQAKKRAEEGPPNVSPVPGVDVTPDQLKELQQEDSSLAKAREVHTFEKPLVPKTSLLGLDKLAALKRQTESENSEGGQTPKRSKISSYKDEDDDDDVEEEGGSHKSRDSHERHYRQPRVDTPSHPGGVSNEAKERMMKHQRERERRVYVSSKHDKDRDRDRDRDREGRHRDRDRDRNYRREYDDDMPTPRLKVKDTPSKSVWDEDDFTPPMKSSWDLPTPQHSNADREEGSSRGHRSSRDRGTERSGHRDKHSSRKGKNYTPLPTPTYKYNEWMRDRKKIAYTPKEEGAKLANKENLEDMTEDERRVWEDEQKRLDREWYGMDQGYDDNYNPFSGTSEEYTKKKDQCSICEGINLRY